MAVFGYIRKEFPEGTMKQLTKLIPFNCEEIFIEEAMAEEEIELKKLMNKLELGDTVLVYHSSVFMKNIRSYADIMRLFAEKEICFISISEKINTKEQPLYYQHTKELANMERIVVQNKTVKGIQKARADGRIGGRPKITEKLIHEITELRFNHKLSLRDIAEKCEVSLGTVHKYVKEEELEESHEYYKNKQEREVKHYEEKKIFA